MFLHVVQCTLSDALLKNEVFELMAVAVVFNSSCDFTETVQKHLVFCAVLLVVPENKPRTSSFDCKNAFDKI